MKIWMRAAAVLLLSTAGCKNDTTSAPPAAAPPTSPVASASAPPSRPAPPAAGANDPCKVVGKLSRARHDTRVVALPDGRVLFVGGGLQEDSDPRAEVDVYDPKTSTVTPFASLRVPRLNPGVAVLADGRVVVIGGHGEHDKPLDTIEVYEPSTKAFEVLPARLVRPAAAMFAIPMKDGRVLTGGGSVPSLDKAIVEWETPRSSFVLDPATGKLTKTGDTPWPLDERGFYTVAESGVITVTGQGEEKTGLLVRDCATTFDPASKAWTDTKRCTKASNPERLTYLFHAANGGRGNAAYEEDGLGVYRDGNWVQLTKSLPSGKTGADLTLGVSLDEHHAVALDGSTYEVVRCSF